MRVNLTTQEFTERARSVHGDRYGYAFSVYQNSNVKVHIYCRDHGMFEQLPHTHFNGHGCIKCSGVEKKDSSSFVKKANAIHDNKYNYSLVEYVGNKHKVKIICHEHGVFEQRAKDHIQGKGCPRCAKAGFNVGKPGYIYLLRSNCGQIVKIGITHNPRKRHSELAKHTPFSFHIIELIKSTGSKLAAVEKLILDSYEPVVFNTQFSGHTEWRLWSNDLRRKLLTLMDEGRDHVQKDTEPAAC